MTYEDTKTDAAQRVALWLMNDAVRQRFVGEAEKIETQLQNHIRAAKKNEPQCLVPFDPVAALVPKVGLNGPKLGRVPAEQTHMVNYLVLIALHDYTVEGCTPIVDEEFWPQLFEAQLKTLFDPFYGDKTKFVE